MKRLATILCLLLLTGCGVTAGRGSRVLPWNWFAPDRATQLGTQQQVTKDGEEKVTAEAHRDFTKTVATLKLDPAPNKFTSQALRFGVHGLGLLNQVNQIPFETQQADNQLVLDLLSENAAIRSAAENRQLKDEVKAAALVRDLEESKARESKLTEQLKASDLKFQAQAEKYRRVVFWVSLIAGGWVLLQVLAGAGRFFPALAPVAHVAGLVSAPVVQAAYNRLSTGVGRALADAGEAANSVRQHLDAHTDAAEQAAIRAKYETAPRT